MYFVGVDLGTSAVKTLLMDENGTIAKVCGREYPLYIYDNGWSEQSPEDWFTYTTEALRELTDGIDPGDIASVSFSGQMHGLVMLDENDNVIRRAILWNDQRTAKQCEYLNEVVGRKALMDNTGNVALTGFTAPKILWVKENEPENFARIRKIMLPKDYLAYSLSGVFATDYSDSSGMLLLDVANKKWSDFMLNICGIKADQLAALYPSYAPVGTITKRASELTGLGTHVKVVIGGGDQAVGAVGSGTVVNNMCSVSLGTSGVVFVAMDDFKADYGPGALHSFCSATGSYHMMGVTLAAAGSNKWWVEDILNNTDYVGEQSKIDELGRNRVFFLPYLNGERTPRNDPDALGTFVGMRMSSERKDMTQAVMEGVSFSLRDTLEIVRGLDTHVNTVRIYGGGAKSPLWCQMTADIFNARVEKINSSEGAAFGAAILAAVGSGAFANVKDACAKLIKATDVYEPNTDAVENYNKRYAVYTKLYHDLKDTFKMINRL
ncbi:MAG: xylulokinase [Clostridiales bacterium]|jgi:xylulokinase|nr:xylulokinase [Clostridiales bacterium]